MLGLRLFHLSRPPHFWNLQPKRAYRRYIHWEITPFVGDGSPHERTVGSHKQLDGDMLHRFFWIHIRQMAVNRKPSYILCPYTQRCHAQQQKRQKNFPHKNKHVLFLSIYWPPFPFEVKKAYVYYAFLTKVLHLAPSGEWRAKISFSKDKRTKKTEKWSWWEKKCRIASFYHVFFRFYFYLCPKFITNLLFYYWHEKIFTTCFDTHFGDTSPHICTSRHTPIGRQCFGT